MTRTNRLQTAACALAILTVGCGALDVSDPTQTEEEDLANGPSAGMMRVSALSQWYRALPYTAILSGLMADELFANPDPSPFGEVTSDEMADRRWSTELEAQWIVSLSWSPYPELTRTRFNATSAISQLRAYASPAVKGPYIGQMLALRGYATVAMAEIFCPGFPLNETRDGRVIPGQPLSTAEAFEVALADFDSALVYAADSVRILNFARLGRARALLGLGRFDDAASAAADVPTEYVVHAEYERTNYLAEGWIGSFRSVADREGGNGLAFASAADPRLVVVPMGKAHDGVTDLYAMAKYPDVGAPIVVASGIEARLIEAEAALNAGDPSWLTILNDLRQNHVTPALADTTDPGTFDAQVDLLFRERAFWLFATAHRLGDLRRLVAQYGRAPETVFPTGAYRLGGTYETGTSLPFPGALESVHNPAVTTCTSR